MIMLSKRVILNGVKKLVHSTQKCLTGLLQENFIPLRRQERYLIIFPNLGALCVFARDRVFPILTLSQNFQNVFD